LLVERLATENNQQAQAGILHPDASGTCLQSFAFEEVPALYGIVLGQFSFKENGGWRT
jgi:hypothetical protein